MEAADGTEEEPKVIPAVDTDGGEAMAAEEAPELTDADADADAVADAAADADEGEQTMQGSEQPEAEPTPRCTRVEAPAVGERLCHQLPQPSTTL